MGIAHALVILVAFAACGDAERRAGDALALETIAPTDVATAIADETDHHEPTDVAASDVVDDAGDDEGVSATEVVDDASAGPDTVTIDTTDATEVGEAIVGPCFGGAAAGHREVTCGEIGFEVDVPDACLVRGACGLIVDIHGWTMTAELEDLNTLMRARGGAAGYVVIQPTAPGLVGIPTWDLQRHAEPIHAFVVEVQSVLGTDPDRSHVMGFSQGGALTWTLVCDHADFYASAVPIGALPGCAFSGADVPAREIDVLAVHGRHDAVVAFSQHTAQRDAALAYWPFGSASVFREDTSHKATRWTTPSGTVLESWEHDYEASSLLLRGHCFPGSTHQGVLPLTFGCTESGTFVIGEVALAFFQAHPR